MNEEIVSEITQKMFRECPDCHRKHKIGHYTRLSSDISLKQLDCHLRFPDYMGSFVENNETIDVFNYPISTKLFINDIFREVETKYEISEIEKYLYFVYYADED